MTKESEKESRVVVDLASIMLHGSIQMTSLKSAPQVALTDLCVDFILFCYNVQCRAIYIIVYIRRFFFFSFLLSFYFISLFSSFTLSSTLLADGWIDGWM